MFEQVPGTGFFWLASVVCDGVTHPDGSDVVVSFPLGYGDESNLTGSLALTPLGNLQGELPEGASVWPEDGVQWTGIIGNVAQEARDGLFIPAGVLLTMKRRRISSAGPSRVVLLLVFRPILSLHAEPPPTADRLETPDAQGRLEQGRLEEKERICRQYTEARDGLIIAHFGLTMQRFGDSVAIG